MDFAGMNRKLKGARRLNLALGAINLVLVSTLAMLGFHILRETNQVVLVPSRISDGMVARGAVDQRYLEALALDAAYAMYTVSAANLAYGRTVIERVSGSGQRAALLARYDAIGEDIRLRKISTVFRPVTLTTDPDRLEIRIDGHLATYLETTQTGSEPRSLRITFALEGASVRIATITRLEEDA